MFINEKILYRQIYVMKISEHFMICFISPYIHFTMNFSTFYSSFPSTFMELDVLLRIFKEWESRAIGKVIIMGDECSNGDWFCKYGSGLACPLLPRLPAFRCLYVVPSVFHGLIFISFEKIVSLWSCFVNMEIASISFLIVLTFVYDTVLNWINFSPLTQCWCKDCN